MPFQIRLNYKRLALFLEHGDVIEVGRVNKLGPLGPESTVSSFAAIMNTNTNLEGCLVGQGRVPIKIFVQKAIYVENIEVHPSQCQTSPS